VIFTWTHNGTSINGSSSSTVDIDTYDDTSVLTISNAKDRDAGSYMCIVSSGSSSVMSNMAILTIYGMIYTFVAIFELYNIA